jgi:hypothetical protein
MGKGDEVITLQYDPINLRLLCNLLIITYAFIVFLIHIRIERVSSLSDVQESYNKRKSKENL